MQYGHAGPSAKHSWLRYILCYRWHSLKYFAYENRGRGDAADIEVQVKADTACRKSSIQSHYHLMPLNPEEIGEQERGA